MYNVANIRGSIILKSLQSQPTIYLFIFRFTKAERELKAARPFGYAPRKFYESSHLVKPDKKDAKGAEAAPPPEAPKPEDKDAEKKTKRLYVAITSDRGIFLKD